MSNFLTDPIIFWFFYMNKGFLIPNDFPHTINFYPLYKIFSKKNYITSQIFIFLINNFKVAFDLFCLFVRFKPSF